MIIYVEPNSDVGLDTAVDIVRSIVAEHSEVVVYRVERYWGGVGIQFSEKKLLVKVLGEFINALRANPSIDTAEVQWR